MLDSATLTPDLTDNSALLGLKRSLFLPAGTDLTNHSSDRLNSLNKDNSVTKSEPDFSTNPIHSSSNDFYRSLLSPYPPHAALVPHEAKSTADFDPITGSTKDQPLVSTIEQDSLSSVQSLPNSSISWGKFGDFDGKQDVDLTIKDKDGKIVETFSLKGDGYGEVWKDNFYEYVSFTNTDETTNVQITALNNIKLDDYIGATLNVQTEGSISAGEIALKDTNVSSSLGLVLQSGLSDVHNSGSGGSYRVTGLNTSPESYFSYPVDLNNSGQVIGYSFGSNHAFLHSDGHMIDLGVLPEGSYSDAYGINNSGQIVGYADTGNKRFNAFLYSDGQMTDLGTLLGDRESEAYGINDSGQVIGAVRSSDSIRAFLYSDGQMTNLGTLPGGSFSVAFDINNRSQVVGRADNSSGTDRAFLYSDGRMTDLGHLPGNTSSRAWRINDSGQVVGGSYETYSRAFLYSDSKMTDLGTLPEDISSYAYGINNSGQVVGCSDGYSGSSAFLYSNGQMTDLNSLIPSESGWTLKCATAINDRGQIVGYGWNSGSENIFLLDPAPTFTSTPKDGITVGNISTLGDSIQLQGQKITLTGSEVMTKGGNITFDGPTKLNNSTGKLAVNSTQTTANSQGGNITLKNTLDSESAGTQSLNLTAGLGNINFDKAVGGNAALKDLTVDSAKKFTAKEDITSSGDITLETSSQITTANLSTNGTGKVNISVDEYNWGQDTNQTNNSNQNNKPKGNVTTGGIDAKQLKILGPGSIKVTDDISSKDFVFIGAGGKITTKKIFSEEGLVGIGSEKDAVSVDGDLTAKKSVHIAADKDITTKKITSDTEVIGLTSHSGLITTTGDITLNGGANTFVDLAAKGRVVTRNIKTQGGSIYLTSWQGAVTSGYLRSDGSSTGGSIYVQASGLFKANASVAVNGGNYSVYTGTSLDGLVRIKHGGGAVNSNVVFAVGNAAINGTAGAIGAGSDAIATGKSYFGSYAAGNIEIMATDAGDGTLVADLALVPVAPPRPPLPLPPFPPAFPTSSSPDRLRRIPFQEPNRFFPLIPYVIPIEIFKNPVTHDTYSNEGELTLTRSLNDQQRGRLEDLIQRNRLRAKDFRKGKKDEDGCYSTELDEHLGGYEPHNVYATWVTGSRGDYLLVTADELANFAFYDGEVKTRGRAFIQGLEPLGSLAEVKTAQYYLVKAAKGQQLYPSERKDKSNLELELYYRNLVAQLCGRKFFLSFDSANVAQAAQSLYGVQYPNVKIYYIKPGFPSYM